MGPELSMFFSFLIGLGVGTFIYHRYIQRLVVEAQIITINKTRNWLSGQAMDQRKLYRQLMKIKWCILRSDYLRALTTLKVLTDEMRDADETLIDPSYGVYEEEKENG